MAKQSTAVAVADQITTALQTIDDVSDLEQYAGAGTENITSNDVRPPVIRICQGQSPQRKKGDAKYIAGLEEPNLFNDLTGQNYGDGPLAITVIKRLDPRAMEFDSDNGVVIDFDVPLDDERLQFREGENGKRQRPIATLFKEYLVLLPETYEVAILSCKGASLKVAETLDSLLKMPLKVGDKIIGNPPAWARAFTLSTAMDDDGAGHTYSALRITSAGISHPAIRDFAAKTFESLKDKTIVRTPEDDGVALETADAIPY